MDLPQVIIQIKRRFILLAVWRIRMLFWANTNEVTTLSVRMLQNNAIAKKKKRKKMRGCGWLSDVWTSCVLIGALQILWWYTADPIHSRCMASSHTVSKAGKIIWWSVAWSTASASMPSESFFSVWEDALNIFLTEEPHAPEMEKLMNFLFNLFKTVKWDFCFYRMIRSCQHMQACNDFWYQYRQ